MSGYWYLGLVVGVLVGVAVVVFVFKTSRTDGLKCKYDERQAIVRGNGFKYGFATLALYNAAYGLCAGAWKKPFMDTLTAMVLGICIAAAVYIVYCIWNDAYFSLNENPKRVLLGFALIALLNYMIAGMNFYHNEMVEDGVLTYRSCNLICAVLFTVIFAALFIKKIIRGAE